MLPTPETPVHSIKIPLLLVVKQEAEPEQQAADHWSDSENLQPHRAQNLGVHSYDLRLYLVRKFFITGYGFQKDGFACRASAPATQIANAPRAMSQAVPCRKVARRPFCHASQLGIARQTMPMAPKG